MPELLLILLLVLVIFGGSKLPQLGSGLGQALRGFKKAVSGEDEAAAKKEEPPKA